MVRELKEETIFARVDRRLAERLKQTAKSLDRPASQIVREAIRKELDVLGGKRGKGK